MDERVKSLLKEGVSYNKVRRDYIYANIWLLFILCLCADAIGLLWFPFTGIFMRAMLVQKEIYYYTLIFPPIMLLMLWYWNPYRAFCFLMVLGKKYFWLDFLLLGFAALFHVFFDNVESSAPMSHSWTFLRSFPFYIAYKFFFRYSINKYIEYKNVAYGYVYYLLFVLSFCFPIIEFAVR